jgi:predicted RNA-binding protein with RPS1 domain
VFHGVEFNATDSHSGGVVLISGASFVHVLASSALGNGGFIFISEHVKIVLENIDDFIRLKRFLDIALDTVDETFETSLSLRVSQFGVVL